MSKLMNYTKIKLNVFTSKIFSNNKTIGEHKDRVKLPLPTALS